jgi:choline dehydrogenase-like flavoprotein
VSGFFDAGANGVPAGLEADYVVIGSGAGGGAAARVLAQAGRSVVVLEDGPLVDKSESSPLAREALSRLFRAGGKSAALGAVAMPILQGRCVGGTTHVNSAIIWRLPEKILANWHQSYGLGETLTEAALEQAYRVLEEELHVTAVDDATASGADRLLELGAGRAKVDHRRIRRSVQGCHGSGRCFHGCPHGAKQSTAINQLRRAVDDGLDLFSSAAVERIDFEGGRAVGVRGKVSAGLLRGQAFTARAKRGVILAASAVQSPNLLRKSGLRLPALGERFMAHPGTSLVGLYPHRVDEWNGAAQGYEAYGLRDTLGVKFETINVPPEITSARMPGAGKKLSGYLDKLPYLASWAAALRADALGTVRPSWLFGDLVRYTLTKGDLDRLRKGLKALGEMHFLAGALEVFPGVHGLPEVLTSADQLKLFDDAPLEPGCYSVLATHLFGGCTAGTDLKTSVVDPQLAVHGTKGLHVMDASVFPTNTGVNPQHAIMAVARVAAARLAAQ